MAKHGSVLTRRQAVAALLGLVAGCDTVPQSLGGTAPPLPHRLARIYVYREPTIYDSTLWTGVTFNDIKVGDCAPGTVFYRDVPPGSYKIEPRSEQLYPGQAKTVFVEPGTSTFAKIQNQPFWGQSPRNTHGTTFTVAIIDPAIGLVEIGRLRLTGG
jgi:hypothetical protein